MIRMLALAAFLVAFAACSRTMDEERLTPSATELANALAGRTAENPVACVNLRELDGQRLFPREEAVVFEGPGSTLYLNRFSGGCNALRPGLALHVATPTGRICEGEIAQIFDATAGISRGSCIFGPFVPYRNAS